MCLGDSTRGERRERKCVETAEFWIQIYAYEKRLIRHINIDLTKYCSGRRSSDSTHFSRRRCEGNVSLLFAVLRDESDTPSSLRLSASTVYQEERSGIYIINPQVGRRRHRDSHDMSSRHRNDGHDLLISSAMLRLCRHGITTTIVSTSRDILM